MINKAQFYSIGKIKNIFNYTYGYYNKDYYPEDYIIGIYCPDGSMIKEMNGSVESNGQETMGDVYRVDPDTVYICSGYSAKLSYRGENFEELFIFENDILEVKNDSIEFYGAVIRKNDQWVFQLFDPHEDLSFNYMCLGDFLNIYEDAKIIDRVNKKYELELLRVSYERFRHWKQDNKHVILKELLPAIRLTRAGYDVENLEYIEEESIVNVYFKNGYKKEVNVNASSGIAMMLDIIQQALL